MSLVDGTTGIAEGPAGGASPLDGAWLDMALRPKAQELALHIGKICVFEVMSNRPSYASLSLAASLCRDCRGRLNKLWMGEAPSGVALRVRAGA